MARDPAGVSRLEAVQARWSRLNCHQGVHFGLQISFPQPRYATRPDPRPSTPISLSSPRQESPAPHPPVSGPCAASDSQQMESIGQLFAERGATSSLGWVPWA